MEKYYRIGDSIIPAKWLFSGYAVSRDGVRIHVGLAKFICANEHAASRAFNRIAAIMGAEDLCSELADEELADEELADEELADEELADEELADEELADEERWKPGAGEKYWTVAEGGVHRWAWDWNGEQGGFCDREKFASGLVFRTKEEAEAALAKMKEQEEHAAKPAVDARWKPEDGEAYWTVKRGGLCLWVWASEQGDQNDRAQFDAGLVFRTRGEAEDALAKMKNSA